MNSIIITPKNQTELNFIHQLLKRMKINGKILSVEEKEDAGLALLMKKVDRTKKVSRETIMSKLKGQMQVEFLSRFNKDVDALSDDKVKTSLLKIIEEVEKANSIRQLSNVKKLIGYKTAYRLKMGEYRIGFFFENSVFQFARFVHRKDIYKVFP